MEYSDERAQESSCSPDSGGPYGLYTHTHSYGHALNLARQDRARELKHVKDCVRVVKSFQVLCEAQCYIPEAEGRHGS